MTDLVESVRVGDCIAIKLSYTPKHDLSFDNRGQTVSVSRHDIEDRPMVTAAHLALELVLA